MITLENVTKTYGPVRALVGVTCTFSAGRRSRPSAARTAPASRRSSRSSARMTRPTSGRIDHGDLGPGSRRRSAPTLGWVGHESLCYPDLTGRENIELAATLHGCEPGPRLRRRRRPLRPARLRRPTRAHLLARAAPAHRPRAGAGPVARGCSSSTSRRRASTPRPPSGSAPSSAKRRRGAPRSSSAPTTTPSPRTLGGASSPSTRATQPRAPSLAV